MHKALLVVPFALLACGNVPQGELPAATGAQTAQPMSFHQLSATDIHGEPFHMESLKGHKVLVVNTASKCGYTPQYKQLEELYRRYKDSGLVVIGFPSNDFAWQEPGNEEAIAAFCEKNYGVTFPMMSKVRTKGSEQSPVYAWLTRKEQNGVLDSKVKWNFQKYLIDEEGRLVATYPSGQEPLSTPIINWVEGK